MQTLEIPVLICGGGGSGLSLSIFLSALGVQSMLVERHHTTSHLPKAHYLNQRSMEILREHGIADTIYAQGTPFENMGCVAWMTSLGGDGPVDGKTLYKMDAFGGGRLQAAYEADSPTRSGNLPLIRLEPVLREFAEKQPLATVRFSHELLRYEQDASGVTSVVKNLDSGEEFTVRSQVLIGSDRHRTVGPPLGIELQGPTNMVDMVATHLSADFSKYIDDDSPLIRWFSNPASGAWGSGAMVAMGPTHFDRRSEEWVFHFAFQPGDPNFNEDDIAPRIKQLLKTPDVDIKVHKVSHWIVECVLANHYGRDRVWVIGDAAHRHPPTTGLGLNSGIQDAHNLAWKIAAVVNEQAGLDLLKTYEAERRPVAERNTKWALFTFMNHFIIEPGFGMIPGAPAEANLAAFMTLLAEGWEGDTARARMHEVLNTQRTEFQAHDIEIGFSYASAAIVADGTPAPPRAAMGDVHVPSTRPGHRLPHAWVRHDARRVSTHDLCGRGRFVLITGANHAQWQDAAAQAAQRHGVRVEVIALDAAADLDGRWAQVRQIGDDGAILVRPDVHVGWRSPGAVSDPASVLSAALAAILAK
ncbi:FAD-dependent monooxygenase [Panacagrimonas sp.]|uniref:FAD-dependent monooxygenase n=1 Tax=Panacagrimonas sp. TaxID=2480088 RepID=UPI003B52F8A6